MDLSAIISDQASTEDIVIGVDYVSIVRPVDTPAGAIQITQETNITPSGTEPFPETLGVTILEEVETKEALS